MRRRRNWRISSGSGRPSRRSSTPLRGRSTWRSDWINNLRRDRRRPEEYGNNLIPEPSSGHLSQPPTIFRDLFGDSPRNEAALHNPIHHRQNHRATNAQAGKDIMRNHLYPLDMTDLRVSPPIFFGLSRSGIRDSMRSLRVKREPHRSTVFFGLADGLSI